MSSAASSNAPSPLPDVEMTSAAPSTASASPHTLPDVLYVQVDGEGGAGALRLQPQDFVQDVMQRAVEQKLIRPCDWIDVGGWELWGSRDKVGQSLGWGTSSERLMKLLPFSNESLLVLTRRSIPLTSSSSASSTSASSSLPSSSSYMLMPMWRPWNQSSEDEPTLQQTAVHNLEELRAHVSRTLGVGWEDPGFYVYPDPDRRVEDRVRVDSDGLLRDWCGARTIFYAYPRTSKTRTPPKDKSGLPLSIRTRRDREETAAIAAMAAARYAHPSSTSTESSTHNSLPRPTASSTTPPGLPKSSSPTSAARALSLSPRSSSSSGSSPPSPPSGFRTPGTRQAEMKAFIRKRDSSRCVFTDKVLPPDHPKSMHASHLLPAAESKRVLHRDFVAWFAANEPVKYDKWREYFQPRGQDTIRRSLDEYPFLLQLPYSNEYDTRNALLSDSYFNDALEKGLLELNIAEVDDTVTFTLPNGASVESSCRPSRSLRSPRHPPESGPPAPALTPLQLRDRLAEWPERKVFEMYEDVWRYWCKWAVENRIPTSHTPEPASDSPVGHKRGREGSAAAAVTPPPQ